MKAIVMTKFGPPDVLQLQEVAKPVPQENEVLIRTYATTLFAADCELRGLTFPVMTRPFARLAVRVIKRRKNKDT
jgi:NADPH:quinone reductase-like Zn-dependent oxidoreductase